MKLIVIIFFVLPSLMGYWQIVHAHEVIPFDKVSPSESEPECPSETAEEVASADFIRGQHCPFRKMNKKYFVVCYRDDWRIPIWVGYRLDKEMLRGEIKRTNDFRPDDAVPIEFQSVNEDYEESGYDRGHMASAESFDSTEDEMSTTFLLTNMAPQRGHMNRSRWRALENRERKLASLDGSIWVFTGNIVVSGEPSSWLKNQKRVAVPDESFKIILRQDGDGKLTAFGFRMENVRSGLSGRKMSFFQRPIRDIEHAVGMDFFSGLPDDIENRLETIVTHWPFP